MIKFQFLLFLTQVKCLKWKSTYGLYCILDNFIKFLNIVNTLKLSFECFMERIEKKKINKINILEKERKNYYFWFLLIKSSDA